MSTFQNNYDEAVSLLHSIVETELLVNSFYDQEKFTSMIEHIASFNSFGLISKEIIDDLLNKYETDEYWRRVWGSIAVQFEFNIVMKLCISPDQIAKSVISILDAETASSDTSLTNISILGARMGLDGAQGHSLNHVNDFWLICIMLFRLTIHQSDMMMDHLNRRAMQNAAPPEKPTKRLPT